jgi:hypothetical protein
MAATNINSRPQENDITDRVKNFFFGNIVSSMNEMNRLMPESLLFGSLLLYILTNNMSFGVFTLFLFEASLSHMGLSKLLGSYTTISPDRKDQSCYVGFRTPRLAVDRILMKDTYPSLGTTVMAAVATYLAQAMTEFKETLDTMGTAWGSRWTVSIALLSIFMAIYLIVRYATGCDTGTELFIATGAGIAIGFLFYWINSSLFGKEAMNFLGLPYLVDKDTEKEQPIYVCSPPLA